MKIQQNISLKKYNTFGVNVKAKRFVEVGSVYELQQLLETEKEVLFIGGGSNILLTSDVDKLVVFLNIKGISIDKEDDNHVYITVNTGENWHEFVLWCIENNYGGIENLSLIPGNVGSCPIQNIGAYGVEVKDVITRVETVELASQKIVVFSNKECCFGYRNSIFKNEQKGKYCITAVSFKLTKKEHNLNISYGTIEQTLQLKGAKNPTIKDISDAVITIRKSKLPDPKEIGNSGSFFKNPIISKSDFKQLQVKYPAIPFYKISENEFKIPAGWLIDKIGFKGKTVNNYGVHNKQALVLVNYGGAKGVDIYKLAKEIQYIIKQEFNIVLEIEVNIV